MADAQGLIADLDDDLAESGEDIVLRRVVGTLPNTVNVDVTVRAVVRSYQPDELINGITQTESLVIISPTQIATAQWPGGELPSSTVANPSLPRKGDKAVIAGRVRNIEVAQPFVVEGELVRIEMRVLG